MIDLTYYIPELYDLKTYGKSFEYLKDIAIDNILSFLKSDGKKRVIIDINHPDGDAVGSAINFAILLEELKIPYLIGSHNPSSKLTFSVVRPPKNDILENLERGIKTLMIIQDNTPWVNFYYDVRKIIEHPGVKENLSFLIIDHHRFIGQDQVLKIRELEREYEGFVYLNYGHAKDAYIWWKGPNIPCAGEISFSIVSEMLKKLNMYDYKITKTLLIPTLLATYTDFRTPSFMASIEDKEVKRNIDELINAGTIKEWEGFQSHFEEFINIANGAIRATGLRVGDSLDTYSLTEVQMQFSPTHKLLRSIAAHTMLAAKIRNPMVLTRSPKDLGYEYGNEYYLSEIIEAEKEWSKIKTIARNAFLYYNINHYSLRSNRVSYFNDTKSIVAILPKTRTIAEYKGMKIDLSKLLKYPPYIEFFLTGYRPIAEMEIVKDASLIIVGIESSRNEGYAEFSFRSKSPSIPAGHFASEITHRIRKEFNIPHQYAFGGGHENAAGLRIKQEILDSLKRTYNLDVYSLMNELIKQVRL